VFFSGIPPVKHGKSCDISSINKFRDNWFILGWAKRISNICTCSNEPSCKHAACNGYAHSYHCSSFVCLFVCLANETDGFHALLYRKKCHGFYCKINLTCVTSGVYVFNVLPATAFRAALGSTQHPIQWVRGTLISGGKATAAWSWTLISM